MQPLIHYVNEFSSASKSEFLDTLRWPVLVSPKGGAPNEESNLSTNVLFDLLDTDTDASKTPDLHKTKVYPLVKRETEVFEGMVNVGRAANNDIVLTFSGISKFHAYFSRDSVKDACFVTDANSKNGTFLNRETLKPYAQRKVEEGDRIFFGGQVEFVFFTPAGFFDLLTHLS